MFCDIVLIMSESFSSRLALADTLQDIHRDVTLRTLRHMNDATISEWDENAIRQLPQEQTRFIHHDTVRYRYPFVELPVPILDAVAIRISGSFAPHDARVRLETRNRETLVEDALLRHKIGARMLEFETMRGSSLVGSMRLQPGVWGEIFVLPDMPPVAVDGLYLKETMYRDPEGTLHQDSDLIQAVADKFGPEALEYVPEEACTAIVRALRRSYTYNQLLSAHPESPVA